MARTWNLTLTPADGTHEVVRGLSNDDMARTLSALVHGTPLPAPVARMAPAENRDTPVETHEPIAA